MFNEAWRMERDYYYDPDMGGLDWKAMGERYRQLLPYVAHRADLDYVLGELQGELSTSHTYVYATGDLPQVRRWTSGCWAPTTSWTRRAACTASRTSIARATGTRPSRRRSACRASW